GAVSLLTAARTWEADGRPRTAAVSSFGISGTNAHVILEEPAEREESTGLEGSTELEAAGRGDLTGHGESTGLENLAGLENPAEVGAAARGGARPARRRWWLWPKSGPARRGQAGLRHELVTARPDLPAADIAHSLATTRALFDHRAVVVDDVEPALAALARGDTHPALITGTAGPGKLAFLFTGQGSQRVGMGRELYEAYPAYAEAFDAVLAHV